MRLLAVRVTMAIAKLVDVSCVSIEDESTGERCSQFPSDCYLGTCEPSGRLVKRRRAASVGPPPNSMVVIARL